MKQLHKKMVIGTLAAGLLVGGGFALQHNQVFANETSTATSAPKKDTFQDRNHKGFEGHGPVKGGFEFGKGPQDYAAILGIDPSVLKEQIKLGKTLVEIAKEKANLTEDELLSKLTASETKKIDDALSAGKIKQEQADKLKSGLAERLKKAIEAKPRVMDFKGKPNQGPRPGSMPGGIWGDPHQLAAMLGITEDELNSERKAGKSIAEIAAAKGITEDQLIAKLKDSLTDELKSFVERKGGERPSAPPHNEGPKQHHDKPGGPSAPAQQS
ncbi:hypothetical protein GCM10008018_19870 [Paenibacillus marchantiophytorum]|uniref:Uncharacterized protein n=1 Tax=Paenibacillus marchantiophytorum TaxID=1619310 RepID=A0ABQ2BV89_9BACL|nr:hypothetical protein [Paenibacillus marchantiophytorum]GGI46980.1 hypothetical protein GCM10008018_19870 [Paenibacillus marchantiophytorum]